MAYEITRAEAGIVRVCKITTSKMVELVTLYEVKPRFVFIITNLNQRLYPSTDTDKPLLSLKLNLEEF